jgi:hypothetical protein
MSTHNSHKVEIAGDSHAGGTPHRLQQCGVPRIASIKLRKTAKKGGQSNPSLAFHRRECGKDWHNPIPFLASAHFAIGMLSMYN